MSNLVDGSSHNAMIHHHRQDSTYTQPRKTHSKHQHHYTATTEALREHCPANCTILPTLFFLFILLIHPSPSFASPELSFVVKDVYGSSRAERPALVLGGSEKKVKTAVIEPYKPYHLTVRDGNSTTLNHCHCRCDVTATVTAAVMPLPLPLPL